MGKSTFGRERAKRVTLQDTDTEGLRLKEWRASIYLSLESLLVCGEVAYSSLLFHCNYLLSSPSHSNFSVPVFYKRIFIVMSKPAIVPETTASGIAIDPRTLERIIPESRRPDGS